MQNSTLLSSTLRIICLACASLLMQTTLAESIEATSFSNPEQEARYRALINEIRCPVCQGQNIAGSNAELAQDLRKKVRELMLKGQSNNDIRKFMTDRYGDFVVFKPPVNKNTYLLWFAPFLFLAAGVFLLYKASKKDLNLTKIDTSKAQDLLK